MISSLVAESKAAVREELPNGVGGKVTPSAPKATALPVDGVSFNVADQRLPDPNMPGLGRVVGSGEGPERLRAQLGIALPFRERGEGSADQTVGLKAFDQQSLHNGLRNFLGFVGSGCQELTGDLAKTAGTASPGPGKGACKHQLGRGGRPPAANVTVEPGSR